MAEDGRSNDQILTELDALSHTLYQAHAKRRTASLDASAADAVRTSSARPVSGRRMSMSPFRSSKKNNMNEDDDDDDDHSDSAARPSKSQSFAAASTASPAGEKKGKIWGWKPVKALTRIGMQRMGCLFSVEVVAALGLPATMDGLRLAVAVRKKETRDGAVQTMPSRVHHGEADFEETLFVRCNLYCTGKPPLLRFEPRPFVVSAVAVDAPELDLGRSAVDLSLLVKESSDKSQQGERVRQWDMTFPLAGKAKGGELVVKLSFQVMDDGGVGLYSQQAAVAAKTSSASSSSSSMFARKQGKSSFSIASPKAARSEMGLIPPKAGAPSPDLMGIDDFKLDEPSPVPVVENVKQEQPKEPEPEPDDVEADDSEFPDFDIVDKGVEGEQEKDEPKEEEADQEKKETEKEEEAAGEEVVKEVVHDSARTWRLNELEAITNQIKALEHMMHAGDVPDSPERQDEDQVVAAAGLDADEEEVTREFLMLLEQGGHEEDGVAKSSSMMTPQVSSSPNKSGAKPPGSGADAATCYISDLGKWLGPVVQTRDGGYLAAMNPFDLPVERKELPKLAMQLSKPFILLDTKLPVTGGAEVFQRLGAGGSDALFAKLGALIAMDDVVGKTAEQIAFEGMASAIITARSKGLVASSSAAHSVSVLRAMCTAMDHGRQERIATGIWNAQETPVAVDEVLAFALQKIEAMAIEALKVQADMADDQAPFEVSAENTLMAEHLLDTAVPPEEWTNAGAGEDAVSLLVVVQLRDPLRRYEAVGAPCIVIIQAARADGDDEEEEPRFKVANLHLGGLRLKSSDRRNMWDGEKQRLTAMHWLVAYGLGKAGRKSRAAAGGKTGSEVLWSMSSRVMADMWLKPLRNPDVRISPK
ncbi:hypothetical protein HU200_034019 [Digitaria exilis]|uniref:C2 NT-type domain-containing protein n=1 Tax=Digitaria exilis TaxID=1010633 RepID=A0A835EMV2_9POAL|nr:hypothetical protein HU200_034019 [Digitaria exilis]